MKAKTKLKTLYYTRMMVKAGSFVLYVWLVVEILITTARLGIDVRNKFHTPVTDAEISGDVTNTPLNVYSVKDKSASITNAVDTHKVQIGDYVLNIPEVKYQTYLAGTSSVETEMYILRIHCSDPLAEDISFVRIGAIGDEPFTEENIQPYLEYAKAYYTQQRYKYLFFDDAAAYKVEAPMEMIKN